MNKEQCLNLFLSHVRQLTADTQSDDDCRVIDWIESFVPELKKHGYTVGYAYETQEVHLVGKVESDKSMADFGVSDVVVIDGVIIKSCMPEVISKSEKDILEVALKGKELKHIKCTPLPNMLDLKTKTLEDLDTPFWVIEPTNFKHTSFIGIAQGAYCIGFITDCL